MNTLFIYKDGLEEVYTISSELVGSPILQFELEYDNISEIFYKADQLLEEHGILDSTAQISYILKNIEK